MKNIFHHALAVAIMAAAFSGCKKDDEKTKTELLTVHNWILTSATVQPPYPGTGTTDWYSQLHTCIQDDIKKFSANGTYIIDEGATKCSAGDPQIYETGTWTFNIDETIIQFNTTGGYYEWSVNDITESAFSASYAEVDSGVTYSFTVVYMEP